MGLVTARSTSTLRNERVERLVDFSLRQAIGRSGSVQRRKSVGPNGFQTEFDHLVFVKDMTLYGQTTCYKERGIDGGEPNKTYEMRETLMEYLLVFLGGHRESSIDFDNVRFFHVILGDPSYSYSYFHEIRTKAYDLNIVANFKEGVQQFYGELEELLPEHIMNDVGACHHALQNDYSSEEKSLVKNAINHIIGKFIEYIQQNFPSGEIGNSLREAIDNLAKSRLPSLEKHLSKTLTGAGIKEKYLRAARAESIDDERIQAVVERIFGLRPFLPEAKHALQGRRRGWESYVNLLFESIPNDSPIEFAVEHLWNFILLGRRALSRRLLIKIPGVLSEQGILYPQDLSIKGVTEHNLYRGEFNPKTTRLILSHIERKFREVGISNTRQMKTAIKNQGRPLIKRGFDYDLKNGTVIRPTLYYIENALSQKGYRLLSAKQALGYTIKGFHSKLFNIRAGAFNSIKVIVKNGIPLILFKAKFFRPQEFDRRVKEEGFVSFTSHFKVAQNKLVPQLEKLPRIMFIDTIEDWKPDIVSLENLYLIGWDIFFDIDELFEYLEQIYEDLIRAV